MSSDSHNAAAADVFRSAEDGRLAHAYLVVGSPEPAGVSFAESVLRFLFCTSADKPCGTCAACRQVADHAHPDILWVEPESKSRVIRIQQIRALNRQIAQSSFAGGWKAAVLMYADRLNVEAANAFLKTLEEPPGQSLLLLLTDSPQGLLPTIISRCQRVAVRAEGTAADRPWVPGVVAILSAAAGGDPLREMVLASQLNAILEQERERIREETSEEKGEDTMEDTEVVQARLEAKLRGVRSEMLQFILLWYRDVLLATLNVEPHLLHNQSHVDVIRAQAVAGSYAEARKRLETVEDMVRRLSKNLPPQAVFEQAFRSVAS